MAHPTIDLTDVTCDKKGVCPKGTIEELRAVSIIYYRMYANFFTRVD